MLIHLLHEGSEALASSEVTVGGDANFIGIGPLVARASETFDMRNRIGQEIDKARVRSGDHVTFRTAGGRYWRPTSDKIADNGTYSGNCQFRIYRSGGGTKIRHGDTVAIAVPRPVGPQHWIVIGDDGVLKKGPAANSMPGAAARFKYFEANTAALSAPRATIRDNLLPGSRRTVVVPAPAGMPFGTVEFEVVLSHEGLPPSGTQVNLDLTQSGAEYCLVASPGGPALPQNGGRTVVMVAPGQARKTLFIEGPVSRPNPSLVFDDREGVAVVPTCALRVAADAVDNFPGHAGDADRTSFFPVAARTALTFLINDQPLFSLNPGERHVLEEYGALSFPLDWAAGLVLTVSNTRETLLPRNQLYEIRILPLFETRRTDHLSPDPMARLPVVSAVDPTLFVGVLPGGRFRFINRARDGTFKHQFRLAGFFATKPVLVGVAVTLDTVPAQVMKPVGADRLAIEIAL